MIARLFWIALAAGTLAGLLAASVQAFGVWPLIAVAETFETAAEIDDHAGHGHDWSPEGAMRAGLSVLFDVLTGIGFALLANAGLLVVRAARGLTLDWRAGLGIGAFGFAAFAFAPAMGVAPALPGMAEGDLLARQIWWVATAAATLVGLGAMAFAFRPWHWALGLLVVALPHAVGAPGDAMGLPSLMAQSGALGDSGVTAELAQHFALASLGAMAAFWIALGLGSAALQRRYLRIA
jgi:cobalt transporter subunit CbtA